MSMKNWKIKMPLVMTAGALMAHGPFWKVLAIGIIVVIIANVD